MEAELAHVGAVDDGAVSELVAPVIDIDGDLGLTDGEDQLVLDAQGIALGGDAGDAVYVSGPALIAALADLLEGPDAGLAFAIAPQEGLVEGQGVARLDAVGHHGKGPLQLGVRPLEQSIGIGAALEIVFQDKFRGRLAIGLDAQGRTAR